MPQIKLEHNSIYLAKCGEEVIKYKAIFAPGYLRDIEFKIERVDGRILHNGLYVDEFGNYGGFETFDSVPNKTLDINIGETWIDKEGSEIKIELKSARSIVGRDENGELIMYDSCGVNHSALPNLDKKKVKTSVLEVKGFIPVFKNMHGELDTWINQMFANKNSAQDYLNKQKYFGKVGGRMDAWKVVPYNFNIELEIE